MVTQPPAAVAPANAPDVLTTKTFLRDEKTGEVLRRETRDSLGVLRELEIYYADKTIGVRSYNQQGKLLKVSRTIEGGGKVEGAPDASGQRCLEWTQLNAKGITVRHMKWADNGMDGNYRLRQFREDGTLYWEKVVDQGKGLVFRMFHEDGNTLQLEAEVGNLRQRVEIYEADGKLLYREKLKDPATARYGDVVDYVGEVFDSAGKVRRRAALNDGPYSGWDSGITNVDELADDGTVKSSARPEREDDTNFRSKLKDKQFRRIVELKNLAYKTQNNGGLRAEVQEQELDDVLRD
ncbi:MAG: hypothetical protein K2W95_05750 [Candidatus Obscuribacterales bacterium]|nr:hypothetical protein [Candidatus Obscuribacterales bacterium]